MIWDPVPCHCGEGPLPRGSKWLCMDVYDVRTRLDRVEPDSCNTCGEYMIIDVLGLTWPIYWHEAGALVIPCACNWKPIDDGDITDRAAENKPIKLVLVGEAA